MNRNLNKFFLLFYALPTLMVGLQAFFDPQAVMDNVDLLLANPSAMSSTRAFYGGVNLFFASFLIYAAFRSQREGLLLAALYAGGFVPGRLYSLIADGQPNAFISTWIVVEIVLAAVAFWLYLRERRQPAAAVAPGPVRARRELV